jgi:hypothetical protein
VGTYANGITTDHGYSREEGDWSQLYYDPEALGMELVAELDVAAAYEFDMVVVWRQVASGRLFAAHDAGCSCPAPFEGVGGLSELLEVRRVEDLDPLLARLGHDNWGGEEGDDEDLLSPARERQGTVMAAMDLRRRVRAALGRVR